MRLALCLFFVTQALAAAEKVAPYQTLRSDDYAFEITVPSSWALQKVLQDDLDTALDSGSAVMNLGGGGNELEQWNGFQFNGVQMSLDPLPTVIVYAHRKPEQNAEALAKIIEDHLTKWGTKPLVKNTAYAVNGIRGLEIEYDIFIRTRIVALFHGDTRYIFHYFVPAPEGKWFKKYRGDFDKVVQSFKPLTSSPAR